MNPSMLAPAGIGFEHCWSPCGDQSFVIIAEGAGNVDAAATVLPAFAGGAVIELKTTPLLTSDECMAALQ